MLKIQQGKQQLARIVELRNELQNLAARKADAQRTLQQVEPEHNCKVGEIKRKHESILSLSDCSIDELNRCSSAIKTLENNLTAKFTGFFGFWHRAFSVKKSAAILLNEIERFPLALKSFS